MPPTPPTPMQGLLHDASRIIGICVSLCGNAACGRGTLAAFAKQLQVEAQAVLVSLMCETKDFTKAEMLCRRLADEVWGTTRLACVSDT
eukprot:365057-Chlamydomonas_euryale.AAC.10